MIFTGCSGKRWLKELPDDTLAVQKRESPAHRTGEPQSADLPHHRLAELEAAQDRVETLRDHRRKRRRGFTPAQRSLALDEVLARDPVLAREPLGRLSTFSGGP